MDEIHQREQYFFDEPTLHSLAEYLSTYKAPCCLCAPMLGKRLSERGVKVTVLDVDRRFKSVKGFHYFDLYKPDWLGQEFDLIVCDPPFFNVSLSQLFTALRFLSRYDFSQKMLVSYLTRRADAVLGTFAPFGLRRMGVFPGYQTVRKLERNEIEFFGNLGESETRSLLNDRPR